MDGMGEGEIKEDF